MWGASVETWLKALKVFVVVAGILIVLGTATLIWFIVQRGLPKDRTVGPATATVPGDVILSIPAGMRVTGVQFDAGRALLLLADGAGRQHLLLVDLATGERLGLLRIVPETP
jgi:hypothetical protein